MPIEKVGVVGCGLMGSGIAHVAALAGFDTLVREVTPELVAKGLQSIEKNLQRQADKGTITASVRDETRARLRGTTKSRRFQGPRHRHGSHHRTTSGEERTLRRTR